MAERQQAISYAHTMEQPVAVRSSETESELDIAVRAAREGDTQALGKVLAAVGPTLLRVCRGVLGRGSAEAEDAAQEAMIAVAKALPAYRGESGFTHYASRIAVRVTMRMRRRQVRQSEVERASEDEGEPLPTGTPADEALRARRIGHLRALLDELPEAQAETLALRVVLGYSLQEVADTTGAPVNTVRSRLRLAREALARRIQGDDRLEELRVQS